MKLLAIVLVSIAFSGCFAPKATTTATQRVPAKFDYSPPSREAAGSSNLVIALVKPRFVGENPEYYVSPFNEMASSMANDFEELLTAKGFAIRGPFGSRDEMVYNDKQNSSFALEVHIDLNPQYNRHYKYDPGLGAIVAPSYKITDEITIGGNLTITASSPQYGEKLWKKNIPLSRSSFTYTSNLKWPALPSIADEVRQDNGFYNELTRELERFYTEAMQLSWQQIEVSEMKTIADQAKKADKRGS